MTPDSKYALNTLGFYGVTITYSSQEYLRIFKLLRSENTVVIIQRSSFCHRRVLVSEEASLKYLRVKTVCTVKLNLPKVGALSGIGSYAGSTASGHREV